MTLVSCFCDLLRSGGDLTLLRRMWGHFCASLGDRKPEYSMQWSRSETVVSVIWLFSGNSSLSYVSERLLFFCFFSKKFAFQSFVCQGLAPRVIRLLLGGISKFKEYSIQFEKEDDAEFCFGVWWEDLHLKKVCISMESLDRSLPDAELVPLSRLIYSLDPPQFPLCIRGASPTLVRVLGEVLPDGRNFVVHERFTSEVFLECFRRAHQNIFGMLEIVTVVEYIVLRMRSALHDTWTEGKTVLRRCIRNGSVPFEDLLRVVDDIVGLWANIRLFIRYTGLPHVKQRVDSVSISSIAFDNFLFVVPILESWFCCY